MEQVNLEKTENMRAKEILAGFWKRSGDSLSLLQEACRSTLENKNKDGQSA